ncbi:hypothetical protein MLD38_028837 [Melastoma candidum]|uniref:Uncharacterized protein n=1 Tax=Melastoma candidum TaxID=119954 RepID=A0ACB9N3I2_9MYRT|nr:hypothetical protein MLD38_028837 [Melastoma candidum]
MDERLLESEASDVGGLLWRVSEESKKLWRITFPAILSRVTAFGIFVVTQAFVGHFGSTELAAYAIMQILGVQFVFGILIGMSSATETLCGQAYVVKLSVSSGVMLCLELWYNAILVLLAGYMKNASVAISAFSICLNISTWEFMICLGFLVGVSVRVSNELGRGNAKAAHFAVKVVLGSSIVIGVILWILCLLFGRELAYIFTSDEDVVETVSSLSVLLAFTILLNSVQPVFSGVAVGCGRQGMVAWVNIGSYYVIGIPLGVVLGYVANLDVQGIWIGMIIGVAIQTLVLGTIIWRTNWDAQVEKAAERLSKFLQKPEDDEP